MRPMTCLRAALLAALLGAGSLPGHADSPPAARILLQTSLTAGLAHHEARQVWESLAIGDALTLQREPDNPHDANAVRVLWRDRMLGYLPRQDNTDVARLLDRGQTVQARIRAIARYRNHRRKLEIELFAPLAAGPTPPPPAR